MWPSIPEALSSKPRAESMRARSCDWLSDSPAAVGRDNCILSQVQCYVKVSIDSINMDNMP